MTALVLDSKIIILIITPELKNYLSQALSILCTEKLFEYSTKATVTMRGWHPEQGPPDTAVPVVKIWHREDICGS